MAIIYVNITELENSKIAIIIPHGDSDENKEQDGIVFYEKGGACQYVDDSWIRNIFEK